MEMLKITLTDDRSQVYINLEHIVAIGPLSKTGYRIPVFYKHKCHVSTIERNYECLCTTLDEAASGKGFDVETTDWYRDERTNEIIEDTLYTTADGGAEYRTKSEMDKFQTKYEKDPRASK